MIRALVFILGGVTLASPAVASEDGGPGLFYPFLNLILLFAVLIYFARKPILEFFNDRRSRIQDDLRAAAEQRSEAEERYASWQRKLSDLDEELETIRSTSRERAQAERDNIIADATATAERIRSDATVAIEQEIRRSREVLREEAADLAVELAENLLRDQVTDADRERLVSEFIERIEDAGPSAGAGSGS